MTPCSERVDRQFRRGRMRNRVTVSLRQFDFQASPIVARRSEKLPTQCPSGYVLGNCFILANLCSSPLPFSPILNFPGQEQKKNRKEWRERRGSNLSSVTCRDWNHPGLIPMPA